MPRKTIIGIAAVILILIAVAFILISIQGIPGAGAAHSTAPGLPGALSGEKTPVQSLSSSQATTVVTDTPLTLKNT